jgi:hypothetical protein
MSAEEFGEPDWWRELDRAVLGCLSEHGAMSPAELARQLGVSESAATSLLCLLAQEGRVRIRLVESRVEVARKPRVA